MKSRWTVFPLIFMASCSALAYEILLTRIFSISLWHHFAFMIISIAMLGLGASGSLLSIFPGWKDPSRLGAYGLLLGGTLSASYLLANQVPFDPQAFSWSMWPLLYIGLYYVLLAIPFFATGLMVATAFFSTPERSGLIYGADLLGAGAGSLLALSLIPFDGPAPVIFFLSMMMLSSVFIVGSKRLRLIATALGVVHMLFILICPDLTVPRMSPYKGLQRALRHPGAEPLATHHSAFSRIDLFRSPAVRFAPGLSLKYLDPLPEQVGLAIDGGDVSAVTRAETREALAFLKYLPSALPYEMGRRDHVLVLDPKGGLQVLMARVYGSKSIDRVESTPSLVRVIEKELKDFSGDIYGERTSSKLGRSWLRAAGKEFDLIDLSMMGAIPGGSFGISEDYRFTVEAFKEYLSSLKTEGLLSLNLYLLLPPRTEWRLVNTLTRALEELGTKNAQSQVAAIRSWGTLCLLVKRSSWREDEIEAIKSFAGDRRFDLVYTPGIRLDETNVHIRMASNEYAVAFRTLLDPQTRTRFTEDYPFDIRSVRDENPFFHYYLSVAHLRDIYRGMGGKWQFFVEEGYLLPVILVQVLFLTFLFVLLPVMVGEKREAGTSVELRPPCFHPGVFGFFASLGLGFMFVEISLIQKMMLPLEHPSLAVAVVLTSLLISSGGGSLASHRMPRFRSRWTPAAIAGLLVLYGLASGAFCRWVALCPFMVKISLFFLGLFPLGFLMGIPFPAGVSVLGGNRHALIPWAWAINGCFSVLAPLLAVMLALSVGFTYVLGAGAASYFFASLTFSSLLPQRGAQKRPLPSVRP